MKKSDLEHKLNVIDGEIEDVRYALENIQDMLYEVTKKIKEKYEPKKKNRRNKSS